MLSALQMDRLTFASARARARVFALLFALTAVLVGAPALAAPKISFSLPNPDRKLPNGNPAIIRPLGQNSNGISFSDCEQDVSLVFHLIIDTTTLPTPDSLQVWAGTDDCTTTAARNATTGTCQPLTTPVQIQNATMTVTIRGRDLAAIIGQVSPPGSGGAVQNFVTAPDDAACSLQQGSAGRTFALAFLAFAPSQNDADGTPLVFTATPQLAVVVDTVGPQPPTGGSIDVGDGLLKVHWTPSGDVSDTFGFSIFCDPPQSGTPPDAASPKPTPTTTCTTPQPPPPVDSGGADTGATDGSSDATADATGDAATDGAAVVDAAADAGTTTPDSGQACTTNDAGSGPVCPSSVIVSGVNGSTINPAYACATLSDKTATVAVVTGLTNGVKYTFAVSGVDVSGNSGPTALIDCQTPAPIADFWDKYRGYGGKAGGAFCALDTPASPMGTSIFAIGVVATAAALVQRRRKK
jgi:hypothetical protein